jgi:hypothetical protein
VRGGGGRGHVGARVRAAAHQRARRRGPRTRHLPARDAVPAAGARLARAGGAQLAALLAARRGRRCTRGGWTTHPPSAMKQLRVGTLGRRTSPAPRWRWVDEAPALAWPFFACRRPSAPQTPPRGRESGPGGLTREVDRPLPSNHPHDRMMLRVDLVDSHGRWKRPCLQTTPNATGGAITIPYYAAQCYSRLDTPACS